MPEGMGQKKKSDDVEEQRAQAASQNILARTSWLMLFRFVRAACAPEQGQSLSRKTHVLG